LAPKALDYLRRLGRRGARGLIGSTEWAETHAQELQSKAVLYLNSDGNSRGFLYVGGSHTLEKFINDVAGMSSILRRKLQCSNDARRRHYQRDAEQRREARDRARFLRISARVPLRLHAVPAAPWHCMLNMGYGGEAENDGIYHSIYDSFDHYIRFSIPLSIRHRAEQTAGRGSPSDLRRRLLPLAFSNFSDTIAAMSTK